MEWDYGLHLPKIGDLAELQTWYQERGKLGVAPDELWLFETANEYSIPPHVLREASQYLPADQVRFLAERGFDLKAAVEWDWADIQWMMFSEAAQLLADEQLRERNEPNGRDIPASQHNRR